MVPLVRSAGGSHQWLAIAFLGLCSFLPPGRLAAPGGDFPGAAVDNLVVRKGDTAVLSSLGALQSEQRWTVAGRGRLHPARSINIG
ncbi:neuronal growth regulator 1 [Pipra filicauda]|uniref:Neuronal growth regulator 1 n=1 Tax=Pipra filicauda TaxID=649802 RepID=A0A7R5KE66_9PASS|nr:neuronal growth regulator 1 [Pipra filicauda]